MPDEPPSDEKPKPAPMSGTLGVLRVFGVPVRLHFTFILLLIFLLFIGVGERQSGGNDRAVRTGAVRFGAAA